jgi:hypothetical protein
VSDLNRLLERIEASQMWGYFHKDWLLQMRTSMRPQLPPEYSIFVESEADAGKSTAALVEVEEPCELEQTYTLLIRRAPANRLVAALEVLSPTNKGVHGVWDRDKFLRKRAHYLESGVNLLEIDGLLRGERLIPALLAKLEGYPRTAWTAFHEDGRRRLSGWGWTDAEPPPVVAWQVKCGLKAVIDLAQTLREAVSFNPWESLVK